MVAPLFAGRWEPGRRSRWAAGPAAAARAAARGGPCRRPAACPTALSRPPRWRPLPERLSIRQLLRRAAAETARADAGAIDVGASAAPLGSCLDGAEGRGCWAARAAQQQQWQRGSEDGGPRLCAMDGTGFGYDGVLGLGCERDTQVRRLRAHVRVAARCACGGRRCPGPRPTGRETEPPGAARHQDSASRSEGRAEGVLSLTGIPRRGARSVRCTTTPRCTVP